jgi:hypothetical protein
VGIAVRVDFGDSRPDAWLTLDHEVDHGLGPPFVPGVPNA